MSAATSLWLVFIGRSTVSPKENDQPSIGKLKDYHFTFKDRGYKHLPTGRELGSNKSL